MFRRRCRGDGRALAEGHVRPAKAAAAVIAATFTGQPVLTTGLILAALVAAAEAALARAPAR